MADSADRKSGDAPLSRRDFIKAAAATGAGLAASQLAFVREARAAPDDLNIAMIGAGRQGRELIKGCLKIPGIRFKAVCDIWSYPQRYAKGILKKYKQPVNVHVDYREMLAKERDIDAVVIATPDWVHAEQTVACLRAGKHVYCEKEMSNTLDGARAMVRAAKETGKLLQIGHQRRSNPRYLHAYDLVHKDGILGRITHAYGQWNRGRSRNLANSCPRKYEIDAATLKKYGYGTMERFLNWRWYRRFSGGAIADLGSHQVDIFSWFLRARPRAVMASGGLDYYKNREWYDNVMAIYEYATAQGTVRSFYQVLNTTSYGGYYEVFMGDAGSLQISEDARVGFFMREVDAKRKKWEDMSEKVKTMGREAIELKIGETRTPEGKKTPEALKMEADLKKPIHMPHLENFFEAVRKRAKLTCPPEVAFETAVPILKTNEAVERQTRIELRPADYEV